MNNDNNGFIANGRARKVSFGKRNSFFESKVVEMHNRCGAEVAVICYRDDGAIKLHGRPSVNQVMERYFNANPPPLLAVHRGVDLVDLGELSQVQIQGVANHVQTLIDLLDARIVQLANANV